MHLNSFLKIDMQSLTTKSAPASRHPLKKTGENFGVNGDRSQMF